MGANYVSEPEGVRADHEGSRPTTPWTLAVIIVLLLPAVLAYSLAVDNELQVLGICIVACALTICFARPFCGLLVFLALLYIRPEDSIPELAGMHFTLVVAIVTLIGMVLEFSLRRESFVRSPLITMIAGLFFAGIASTIVDHDPSGAMEDIGRLVILAVLVLNLVRTQSRYAVFTTAIVALSAYLGVYSMVLYFNGGAIHQDGILRSEGTGIFGDPNDLAATIVPAIALIIPRFTERNTGGKWPLGLLGAVILGAVLLTNSRGGALALGAVVVGTLATSNLKASAKFTLVALAAMALVAGSGRMTNFDASEASANSRFWFWDNGLVQLMKHPLFGVGYGGFADVNGGMVAHNSFVQAFAELGLFGYFFWIGSIYVSLRGNAAMTTSDPRAVGELNAARIALVAYLVASFWLTHTYNPIFFILLCLPIAPRFTAEGQSRRVRPVDVVSVTAICVASIGLIKLLADQYK